jgi:hypothetical protein
MAVSGLAILLLLQAGCATQFPEPYELIPNPPSPQVRAKLGRVKLVASQTRPVFEFRRPSTIGESVGSGVKGGLSSGLPIMGAVPEVYDIFLDQTGMLAVAMVGLGAATSIVGAPVGGLVGLTVNKGVSKKKIRTFENTLAVIEANGVIQQTVRQRAQQAAREQAPYLFDVPAAQITPAETEQADTLLEISVQEVSVAALDGRGSPLMLVIKVNARLVEMQSGRELYHCPLVYRSKSGCFKEWSENNAAAFLQEVNRGCDILAGKIVKQMFSPSREVSAL